MSSATPTGPGRADLPGADDSTPPQPAADRAYQHVKSGLLDGGYPDGHLLSEGEIATRLNMSRTPVREAFLRLQTEGFLRLYPKRGALVVPVTPTEARALMEARLAMESFAIDKLRALGPEAVTEAGRALSEHPACTPGEISDAELHEVDRDFHAQLVTAANNPVIADLYNALRDRQLRITSTARTHEPVRRANITRQHTELAQALRDGEPELAKTRLRHHLVDTVRAFGVAGGPLLDSPDEH